jgi:hypothetical protein
MAPKTIQSVEGFLRWPIIGLLSVFVDTFDLSTILWLVNKVGRNLHQPEVSIRPYFQLTLQCMCKGDECDQSCLNA